MKKPQPPFPPPIRTFKYTFFSGLVETEESKQLTREWDKYKANYRSEISQCGYIINNPYMR